MRTKFWYEYRKDRDQLEDVGLDWRIIAPCSPMKVNRRFGGRYRLHLQGRTVNQTRYEHNGREDVDCSYTSGSSGELL
jgi:hypothetical protein